MGSIFIDTNILVYAVDRDAGDKHQQAKDFLSQFYLNPVRCPSISVQVLQEFSNRLYRWDLTDEKIQILLEPMRYWNVVANDLALFQFGLEIKRRYKTSYWDSFIIAAAIKSGAKEIWTEDLNTGQHFEGVRVVNPFTS